MKRKYIPKRGDIIWLEFEPQAGNEIKKTRPALVISPQQYNKKTKLALVMPVTSQVKGYPFEEKIKSEYIKGVILCDQIRSLDWVARKARYICSLEEYQINEIIEKFKTLID